jgi:hypothetical protein
MGFTNSSLVNYTKISPNKTANRNHAIDTITIHCVVGQCSVETIGNVFAPTSRKASSNYGVGFDGRIGMYVEEKDRSWCSSSASNDHRAITIEVASDTKEPYAVNDKAYASLINLVTDICQRNGIKELKWKADKSLIGQVDKQNMTVHRWFANKSCPGTYLYNKMGEIAAEVNKRLNPVVPQPTPTTNSVIKVGSTVKISDGATYYTGKKVPAWVTKKTWIVSEINGDRAVIDKSTDGQNSISSPINVKFLTIVGAAQTSSTAAFEPYMVRINVAALNIRKGAGTNYGITGCIRDRGVYTIVDESNGWGKLKSGAGWISLKYTKKI